MKLKAKLGNVRTADRGIELLLSTGRVMYTVYIQRETVYGFVRLPHLTVVQETT